jgi:hypothetical protein
MHPRIQETLDYLDSERAALREAVDQVPPRLRERQPGPDRWSVAQVLQHLTLIEVGVAKLVAKRLAEAKAEGLGPEVETSSILNSINVPAILDRERKVAAPERVRPQTDVEAAAAWLALEQARATLCDAVLSGDGIALSEVKHQHPVLGLCNLYQWLLFVGSHEARHTAQIREIANELATSSTTPSASAG